MTWLDEELSLAVDVAVGVGVIVAIAVGVVAAIVVVFIPALASARRIVWLKMAKVTILF